MKVSKKVTCFILAILCALTLAFVSAPEASAASNGTVTVARLNIRSKASKSSKIVATVSKGTSLTIKSTTGSYYKITYKGKTGYVKKTYIKKKTSSSNASSYSGFSNSDIKLLAGLCQYESGTNYNGCVAVANVVLNRMKSSSHPNSLRGVIYQKYQFGTLYKNDVLSTRFRNPSSTCIKAVKAALNGTNNVGSRKYFRSVSIVRNRSQYSNYKVIAGNLFY